MRFLKHHFVGLLAPLCLFIALSQGQTSARQDIQLGSELFNGKAALKGRMSTHLVDLPPEAVRCSNCHASASGTGVRGSNAPRLTRQLLLVPQRRRGGPPSRYNLAGFCNLLRKGVDPAYVVVDEQMPRYTLDNHECSALWRFLTEDFR